MTAKRFTIHESTQRVLCRLAFLAIGAAPLVACIYLCIATFIPGYSRRQAVAWQEELSNYLGTPIQIDEAFSLAPMCYQLRGIRLMLPDAQGQLGSIESAEIRWNSNGFWSVTLAKPTIQMDRIGPMTQLASQISQRGGGLKSLSNRVVLQCDQLQLEDAIETIALKEFRLQLIPHTDVVGMRSDFKVAMNNRPFENSKINTLVALLDRAPDSTNAKLQLKVQSPISCYALAKALAVSTSSTTTQALQQSQFKGTIDVRHSSLETSYYLSEASIQNFDIAQFSGGVNSVISGTGTLNIQQAKLRKFQLDWLQGSLDLGPGRIDANVLDSLSKHLGIQLTRQIAGAVGFDRLSANFIVQADDLRLYGNPSERGMLLSDAQGVIAWKRDTSKLPIITLVNSLLPRPEQPAFSSRTAPLVRTALIWLPIEESQRKEAELVIHR